MRTEDALRKIGLLRKVRTENGAMAPEAENAARLAKALMERFAIRAEDIPTVSQRPAFRMTWIYCRNCWANMAFSCAISAAAAMLRSASTRSFTSTLERPSGGSNNGHAAAGIRACATGVSSRCAHT
jgi:hypothetical protein